MGCPVVNGRHKNYPANTPRKQKDEVHIINQEGSHDDEEPKGDAAKNWARFTKLTTHHSLLTFKF